MAANLTRVNLKEILRDYRHAEYTFRSDKFQYAPRFKFLFHVYFDINPDVYFTLNVPPNPNLGLAVKTVKLPQYTIQTQQMNQYNRKRIVNTKIRYDQVSISFHDDNSNAVRNMWYNYYSYYFDDPNNTGKSPSQSTAQVTSPTQNTGQGVQSPISYDFTERNQYKPESNFINQSWGYVGEGDATGVKKPFFRSIVVYGFNQKTYVAYTLINPVITSFAHDTYSYADGAGTMENNMGIDYEFVKYDTGAYNGENPEAMVLRFAERPGNYDHAGSPNKYGNNASDATTLNRETVPNSQEDRSGMPGYRNESPEYSGYRTPSGDPYHPGVFLPPNADNNTYMNRMDLAAQKQPITQQAVQQALEATSPRSLRNAPFSTPAYGSTPTSIGVAGSIVTPNISPDSAAVIADPYDPTGGRGGP